MDMICGSKEQWEETAQWALVKTTLLYIPLQVRENWGSLTLRRSPIKSISKVPSDRYNARQGQDLATWHSYPQSVSATRQRKRAQRHDDRSRSNNFASPCISSGYLQRSGRSSGLRRFSMPSEQITSQRLQHRKRQTLTGIVKG
jgi:hypothetical protein